MPHKPKKQCAYPRCNKLVAKERYCPDHQRFDASKIRIKRGKTDPWYLTKFWRQLRALKLKENPLCEYCEDKERLTQANIVDHKIPWKTGRTEEERWRLFSDFENLASCCQTCHTRKSAKEMSKEFKIQLKK